MNTGNNRRQVQFSSRTMTTVGRFAAVVLAGVLLNACGQDSAPESAGTGAPAAAPVESKPFVTDAAIKSAQQAVESAEQRALKQSVRISGEVEKTAAQQQQESAQTLEAASKKTDEMLRQAAVDAAAAASDH